MLTPFTHYLQSNQAPSEDEIREIKALRANPLEEISVIDVEIEQIEGILISLKRKRAHILKTIDDLKYYPCSCSSPIYGYFGRNIQSLPYYTSESSYERQRSSHTSHSDL
jgi:hypothetical protein